MSYAVYKPEALSRLSALIIKVVEYVVTSCFALWFISSCMYGL
jgi:hypothetical protein